jgi:hypothetical protein
MPGRLVLVIRPAGFPRVIVGDQNLVQLQVRPVGNTSEDEQDEAEDG